MSYTPPVIPPNQPVSDPGLADLSRAIQQNVAINTNCHAIGTITSFQKNAQYGWYTVNLTLNYSRTYYNRQSDGTYQMQQVAYPNLTDVPLVIMTGGSSYLQMPVSAGDQVLVLFNDRDINNWFAGAHSGPVATARTHSLADALAIVGFNKIAGAIDPAHAMLTNGTVQLGIQATGTKILIANNSGATTLNDVLGSLVTAINNIVIAVSGSAGVVNSASQAALTAVATQLSNLLE